MLAVRMRPMRGGFFDRPKVQRAIDRANRRNLSRAGAFVRQRMKTSILKSKQVARPGEPPSSHSGELRRFLFFAYDFSTRSVVVGPEKIGKKGNVPALLEQGGRGPNGREYAPHPYAEPALEAERGNFPEIWRNSIRG